MKFKDFEIRLVKSIDGVINPKRFELVKWYDHEPTPVTNMRTGKVENSTRSCFVVAWLEWDAKESCFELTSVGLRLVEHWADGLDQFIIKWCEMAEVCMEEDNE